MEKGVFETGLGKQTLSTEKGKSNIMGEGQGGAAIRTCWKPRVISS